MSISMCVSNEDGGHILLGEFVDTISDGGSKVLTKIVELKLVQNPQNGQIGLGVFYYPTMVINKYVKEKVLNDMTLKIDEKEYLIFNEEDIETPILDRYKEEMTRRSGILLAKEIPQGLRLVNK